MPYKVKISFLFVFLNTLTYGQLTLDYSSFTEVGDSIIEHYDTEPNIDFYEKSGENMTWDFSDLVSDFKDTLSFVEPKNTLFWEDFKNATIAMKMSSTDSVVSYFTHSKKTLLFNGTGYFNPNRNKEIYKQNLRVINYPLNYLDEDYQVFESEEILFKNQYGNDSIKKIKTEEYFDKVDAWGDLKMPSGIFFALRIKREVIITEAFYELKNNAWQKYQEKQYPNVLYQWWTDESKIKHQIVYFVMDTENGNVIHASFIDAIPFEEKVEKLKDLSIKAYPNPTRDFLNVKLPLKRAYINIYDIQGRLVLSKLYDEELVKINISHLNNGIYVLVVKDPYGKIMGKQKIIKN